MSFFFNVLRNRSREGNLYERDGCFFLIFLLQTLDILDLVLFVFRAMFRITFCFGVQLARAKKP